MDFFPMEAEPRSLFELGGASGIVAVKWKLVDMHVKMLLEILLLRKPPSTLVTPKFLLLEMEGQNMPLETELG